MKKLVSRLAVVAAALLMLAGIFVAFVPTDTLAGGKKPPKCTNCPPTITLPDGRVCTLTACGSDCVYQCPF